MRVPIRDNNSDDSRSTTVDIGSINGEIQTRINDGNFEKSAGGATMIQIGFYLSQPRTAELEKGSCRGGGLSRISVVFENTEDSSKWASPALVVPFVPTNPLRTRKQDTTT